MNKVNFIIGFHSHQPVGNFDFVLEDAIKRCYKPLLETIRKFPGVKVSLHFSGILYEYFIEKHPYLMDWVREMVDRGQVEIMSGGFYEPILPIIPEEDAVQQIQMMNQFIRERFNFEPAGIWLTERVWEPHLPSLLRKAGMRYTVVDDAHLLSGGVPEGRIFNLFLTEHNGEKLFIFPISKKLRYLIPFREIDETIEFLGSIGGGLAVIADDGEKFGVWPGTYKRVYEEGYLEEFFRRIESTPWIETLTFKDALEGVQPEGPVYMPTASYSEMMEWVLPTEDRIQFEELEKNADKTIRKFLKGGFFRNFFLKYPEANHMHKRMLMVSEKLRGRGIEEKIDLFKAQCNCAYWHGVFGGLYLPHLRQAIYQHLIMAERGIDGEGILIEDFDLDGEEEAIIRMGKYNLILHPSGGKVIEFDIKEPPVNLMNVITRRKEAYHRFLGMKGNFDGRKTIHEVITSKDEDLERFLKYDSVRLGMFCDLTDEREDSFTMEVLDKKIIFSSPSFKKTYTFFEHGFNVQWEKGEGLPEKVIIPLATYSEDIEIQEDLIRVKHAYGDITIEIEFDGFRNVEMEDIYTITSSEGGLEKTKQGVMFTLYTGHGGVLSSRLRIIKE
ncbi:4-alpha-glucanotransferase [bacterium]|nr:MAG: 4-alpha-glucanotransferase [bacterium]